MFDKMQVTQVVWKCKTHSIPRIWVDDGSAICLKCAIEQIGFTETSRLLNDVLSR